MVNLTIRMAIDVINADTQALRFEQFANGIVSRMEGDIEILSTSWNYDQGRDGKTAGPGPYIVVLSSLNDKPEKKSFDDIEKVAAWAKMPERVYFCSSQEMTEYKQDHIRADLAAQLPDDVSVEVLDVKHLAQFAERAPDVINRHYAAELQDKVREQQYLDNEDAAETALQLALCAMGHQDSAAIRNDTYSNAIRVTLLDGKGRNVAEIGRDLSGHFRLNHSIPPHALKPHLSRLVDEGQIEEAADRYTITEAGKGIAQQAQSKAIENLAKGREAVRKQIEAEIGTTFLDDQYARMWSVLQDKMVHLFYTRGREMLDCISYLVSSNGKAAAASPEPQPFFVRDLAQAVAATCSSAAQGRDVKAAIEDIFSEGIGAAFTWLLDVCGAFMALCSLGLEATSGEQIKLAIAGMSLVLDTDIVLSLLCAGEADNASVTELVKRWRELGGKILIAHPVLHETAHHAWIAQQDFDECAHRLPGTPEDRVRFIRNAFVRGFAELMAQGKARLGHWKQYIDQFRGKDEHDVGRVSAYLRDNFRAGSLPRISQPDTPTEVQVFRYCEEKALAKARSPRDIKISTDKAKRDAELFISLERYATALADSDSAANCFLVSSSRRLAEMERKFGNPAEGESRILSVSSTIAVLSIVPGVTMGMTAMRSFLFDGSISRGKDELEMALRRIVRESESVSMPFAKRSALKRAVSQRIILHARANARTKEERNQLEREIEDDIMYGRNGERAATIISEALDAVSVDRRVERQLGEAQKEIERLKTQLKLQRGR